jgi:hypothetical protein
MYDSFWELHHMAVSTTQLPQWREPRSENEEVQQDMFDTLSIEPCLEHTHFFEHNNAAGFSRSLPRQASGYLESADDSPNTIAPGLFKHDQAWSVPIPAQNMTNVSMRASESTLHVESRRSLQGETVAWITAAELPTFRACQEPIDLTRLLNRCEGDVELLTEVRTATNSET